MSLKNLAAILDPDAPDDRPLIIEVSSEGDERLRLSYGEGRKRIAAVARGASKTRAEAWRGGSHRRRRARAAGR